MFTRIVFAAVPVVDDKQSIGDKNTDEYLGTGKKPGNDTRNNGTSSEQNGFYSMDIITSIMVIGCKQSKDGL